MNILNFQVAILAEKYATDYKWYGYVDNHQADCSEISIFVTMQPIELQVCRCHPQSDPTGW